MLRRAEPVQRFALAIGVEIDQPHPGARACMDNLRQRVIAHAERDRAGLAGRAAAHCCRNADFETLLVEPLGRLSTKITCRGFL